MKSSPADQVAARLLQRLTDDAVDVVDDLEPLQLLESLDAGDAHVDHAELPVVGQHPLHLDLDIRQRRQSR